MMRLPARSARLRKVREQAANPDESQEGTDKQLDLRVWLRLMTVHKLVRNEISRRLREKFGVTLPRFDLMSQLRRNSKGMRMVELSRRLMVTNGNITAITDQLEKEDLARRAVDSRNRSAFIVRMTPRGTKAFDAMAREHRKWLADLLAGLTHSEKQALLGLLGRQKAHLVRAADHPGERA